MTNDDTAIAAQMRAFIKAKQKKFKATLDYERQCNWDTHKAIAYSEVLDHLDTLTSKRWRVAEGHFYYWVQARLPVEMIINLPERIDIEPGARVLIVTEDPCHADK
jgi:hypothetical protein